MRSRQLASLCLALVFATQVYADRIVGTVVGVTDGDTLTVLDWDRVQHKIRLAAIDAPEKRQAFGERSKQHLSGLVYRKTVEVEYSKRDRYGRIVGKVRTLKYVMTDESDDIPSPSAGYGPDVGLEQVRAGLAWHYKKYEMEQSSEDRHAYSEAEKEARSSRRGLWQDPQHVPPWEWREVNR